MPTIRSRQPAQFAATLVHELNPERVSSLPAPWLQARRAYINLTSLPLRPVKTAETTRANLVRSILDAAQSGTLNGKLDVDALVAAEALDHRVELVNGLLRTAQQQGRVDLVLSVYDEHKPELIRAVKAEFGRTTAKLWKAANGEDLASIDPELAAAVGGKVAQQMAAVVDMTREAQAFSDLVRTLDDGETSDGRSYWFWWTKDDTVLSRRVNGRALNDTTLGVAGSPEFWLNLARVVDHDVIWAPSFQEAEQRLAEIEAEAVRKRASATGAGVAARR
jgi:hypothetical protein